MALFSIGPDSIGNQLCQAAWNPVTSCIAITSNEIKGIIVLSSMGKVLSHYDEVQDPVIMMAWDLAGRYLAFACATKSAITIWDVANNVSSSLSLNGEPLLHLCWSRLRTTLLYITAGKCIGEYDRVKKTTKVIQNSYNKGFKLVYAQDWVDGIACYSFSNGDVWVLSESEDLIIDEIKMKNPISFVASMGRNSLFMTSHADNQMYIWDAGRLIQLELPSSFPLNTKVISSWLVDNTTELICQNGQTFSCTQRSDKYVIKVTGGKIELEGITAVQSSRNLYPYSLLLKQDELYLCRNSNKFLTLLCDCKKWMPRSSLSSFSSLSLPSLPSLPSFPTLLPCPNAELAAILYPQGYLHVVPTPLSTVYYPLVSCASYGNSTLKVEDSRFSIVECALPYMKGLIAFSPGDFLSLGYYHILWYQRKTNTLQALQYVGHKTGADPSNHRMLLMINPRNQDGVIPWKGLELSLGSSNQRENRGEGKGGEERSGEKAEEKSGGVEIKKMDASRDLWAVLFHSGELLAGSWNYEEMCLEPWSKEWEGKIIYDVIVTYYGIITCDSLGHVTLWEKGRRRLQDQKNEREERRDIRKVKELHLPEGRVGNKLSLNSECSILSVIDFYGNAYFVDLVDFDGLRKMECSFKIHQILWDTMYEQEFLMISWEPKICTWNLWNGRCELNAILRPLKLMGTRDILGSKTLHQNSSLAFDVYNISIEETPLAVEYPYMLIDMHYKFSTLRNGSLSFIRNDGHMQRIIIESHEEFYNNHSYSQRDKKHLESTAFAEFRQNFYLGRTKDALERLSLVYPPDSTERYNENSDRSHIVWFASLGKLALEAGDVSLAKLCFQSAGLGHIVTWIKKAEELAGQNRLAWKVLILAFLEETKDLSKYPKEVLSLVSPLLPWNFAARDVIKQSSISEHPDSLVIKIFLLRRYKETFELKKDVTRRNTGDVIQGCQSLRILFDSNAGRRVDFVANAIMEAGKLWEIEEETLKKLKHYKQQAEDCENKQKTKNANQYYMQLLDLAYSLYALAKVFCEFFAHHEGDWSDMGEDFTMAYSYMVPCLSLSSTEDDVRVRLRQWDTVSRRLAAVSLGGLCRTFALLGDCELAFSIAEKALFDRNMLRSVAEVFEKLMRHTEASELFAFCGDYTKSLEILITAKKFDTASQIIKDVLSQGEDLNTLSPQYLKLIAKVKRELKDYADACKFYFIAKDYSSCAIIELFDLGSLENALYYGLLAEDVNLSNQIMGLCEQRRQIDKGLDYLMLSGDYARAFALGEKHRKIKALQNSIVLLENVFWTVQDENLVLGKEERAEEKEGEEMRTEKEIQKKNIQKQAELLRRRLLPNVASLDEISEFSPVSFRQLLVERTYEKREKKWGGTVLRTSRLVLDKGMGHEGEGIENKEINFMASHNLLRLQDFYSRMGECYAQMGETRLACACYCRCRSFGDAIKLICLAASKSRTTSSVLSLVIPICSVANDRSLSHTVEDFLLGKSGNGETICEPCDLKLLYSFYLTLEWTDKALETASKISQQLQETGKYLEAHQILANSIANSRRAGSPLSLSVLANFNLLHSYILVKKFVSRKNHLLAANLLLRVSKSIDKFPQHAGVLLTSAALECTRAQKNLSAQSICKVLMTKKYNDDIPENFRHKIEAIVRREQSEETVNILSPCPWCEEPLDEMELSCSHCRSQSPICIASGKHLDPHQNLMCTNCCMFARTMEVTANDYESCSACGFSQSPQQLVSVSGRDAIESIQSPDRSFLMKFLNVHQKH